MRKRFIALVAVSVFVACFSLAAFSEDDDEVTLFDAAGKPVAYVAEGLVVYEWSGKPVAFISGENAHGVFDIYGFNGKHLGWFISGLIHDHEGATVGGLKEDLGRSTEPEPPKGPRQPVPPKAPLQAGPARPDTTPRRSLLSLESFLLQGVY